MSIENVFTAIDVMLSQMSFDKFDVWTKEDGSFITSLDIILQTEIIATIKRWDSTHNIVCEELYQNSFRKNSDFNWVIDPIDGTGNFVKGKSEYAISVGLMNKHEFLAAYVNFPALKETYCCINDSGVYKNGIKLSASNNPQTKEVILCSKTFLKLKSIIKDQGYQPSCYYCATFSMLKVLNATALMYHTINTNLYDVGPMSHILKQAGIITYNEMSDPVIFAPNYLKIPFIAATHKKSYLELLH